MSGPTPELSVCVAAYRLHEAPDVLSLLEAMPAAADGLPWELVVTLNGIADARLEGREHVRTVPLDVNHGVSIGWNRAAAVAGGRVLAFVNDDVLPGPGSLRRLVEALDADGSIGVCGPSATLWDLPAARHRGYLDLSRLAAGTTVECDVVSGYLLAVRARDLEAVGGFDEAFTPAGFEEVALCTAMRVELGRRCVGVAGVEAVHEFGISAASPDTPIAFLGRQEAVGSIAARNRRHFLATWDGRFPPPAAPPDGLLLPDQRWRRALRSAGLRVRGRR